VARYSPLAITSPTSREDSSDEDELIVGWCAFDMLSHGVDRIVTCLEISMTDWTTKMGSVTILYHTDRMPTNNLHRTHEVLIIESTEDSNDRWHRIGIGMIDADLGVFMV
jgi:hypothetical protein